MQLDKTEKYIKAAQDDSKNIIQAQELQSSKHYLNTNVTVPPAISQVATSPVNNERKERETMTSPRLISSNIVEVQTSIESENIKALNNQLNQVRFCFLYNKCV